MGQCQDHNFLTAKDKNMRFLPIHRSLQIFYALNFIILLVFTLEQQENLSKWNLKINFFQGHDFDLK